MASPLVSIALTTLNGSRYIRESIESCLGQTYSNIELLIVDGGSTDGTVDIALSYSDPRMRIIHQRGNDGKLPGAINLGLSEARGDYLTWMQDDSIYHPRAIEVMAHHLDTMPDIGHVYADFWQIDEHGDVQKTIKTCEPDEIISAKDDPCGVCFMIRRSVREVVGPHDIDAYPTQDYDYRLRIAMRFHSYRIREPLYYWRLHPYSLTGSRPWTVDAKNDVQIRLRLGLSNQAQARHDLGDIDVAYAFECYSQGAYAAVPGLVYSALRNRPIHALNRGVWSIMLKSMMRSAGHTLRLGSHAAR